MDISIVVPNYNGEKLLEKSLPRLLKILENYKDGETEIIIVDDDSTDKSVDLLKKYDVEIFINDKNLGFSSTVNKGVKKAKGEIVILLNTDVFPEKDFLNHLLEHFKDPKVFAVGCMDKSIEGDKTILRGRGLGAWKRGFLVHRRGEVNKTDTLWVSGGSGAFRKTIWDRLSGLNELYDPFYYEDIDLSYRALKAGYKILFEPKSVVYHEHEKGAIKSKHSSFQIKTIAYRNQFIFVWENATDWDFQLLHFLWLPYHFAKAILRGDVAFLLGFLKAFILLPKIIKSSLGYQKLFIKKDREII
ncbi:MAG: glycosyltransferase family 2 protein [Patescibacteria group bacterium]|nr:glycosyltransferase family 2 protein [Patescibacteria group bacterium]